MLNRVILIGRLANDPELKYTPSGIAVTQFRIAVDRPISAEARAQGQEKQADFIDIVSWRQNAEFAANYLTKGRLVAVEGRLQVREYVTQEGQKRRAYEVVSDNLKGLDRPKDTEGGDNGGGGGGYAEAAPRGGGNGYSDAPRGGGNSGGGGGGYDRAPAAPSRGGNSGNSGGGYASGGGASRGGGRNTPPPASGGGDFDDEFGDLSDPFAE